MEGEVYPCEDEEDFSRGDTGSAEAILKGGIDRILHSYEKSPKMMYY
jgi:hypothetical protein